LAGSTLFTDAMALTPAGDGRYDGELNEHWTIGPKGSGPKVHGGAMLALCANAARMAHGDEKVWPIAISGNFLWAPVVPLMTPEPPPGLEPIAPGHPMADVVNLAHGCDIRPSLTTMEPRADGGRR
jgi:hypothetical protein